MFRFLKLLGPGFRNLKRFHGIYICFNTIFIQTSLHLWSGTIKSHNNLPVLQCMILRNSCSCSTRTSSRIKNYVVSCPHETTWQLSITSMMDTSEIQVASVQSLPQVKFKISFFLVVLTCCSSLTFLP